MNVMMRPDSVTPEKDATYRTLGPLPEGHPGVRIGKVGVLLLNLGTPDATDYWSMRRYLKEFLSDRRVIEVPRLLWWPILNLIILTVRPGPKGKDYDTIWNKERNEGPLKTITRSQAEKLAEAMAGPSSRVVVDWAMRYGNPSTESRMTPSTDGSTVSLTPVMPSAAKSALVSAGLGAPPLLTTRATSCASLMISLAR